MSACKKHFAGVVAGFLGAAAAGCGGGSSSGGGTPVAPARAASVGHVFVIVLENKGYDRSFTADPPPSPYLARTLPSQGQLLTHYYGIGHASLDNYIAMISGQPPNAMTQADCPLFLDLLPGIADPAQSNGVLIGQGCIYPVAARTVADQLEAAGLTWRGYMQDMGADPAREAATCGHPPIDRQDNTESATAADQYATRHDPFMYFRTIIDDHARCDAHVVNLDLLDADLASEAATPNFVFITPDLCADGHDGTCADGTSPGGYDGIDAFLSAWVPKITASPAYRRDGLLIVIFDESDDNNVDGNDACCNEPTGPNTTGPGAGNAGANPGFLLYPGGGRVGGVILSPFTRAGSVNDTPYNHYSLLRSIENIFGLEYLGYAGQDGLKAFGDDVFNGP